MKSFFSKTFVFLITGFLILSIAVPFVDSADNDVFCDNYAGGIGSSHCVSSSCGYTCFPDTQGTPSCCDVFYNYYDDEETCSNEEYQYGECAPNCIPECDLGEERCSSGEMQTCDIGINHLGQPCPIWQTFELCGTTSCTQTDDCEGVENYSDYPNHNSNSIGTCDNPCSTETACATSCTCTPEQETCTAGLASALGCTDATYNCGGGTLEKCHKPNSGTDNFQWTTSPPATESACQDTYDNDCDGLVDCADTADCGTDPACQTGTETHPSYPAFVIQDSSGDALAVIGSNGAMKIKGETKTWSNPTSGNHFVIQNSAGNPVAWIHGTTGDLYHLGQLWEHEGTIFGEPSSSGNFVIQNTAGTNVAFFTSSGDLYLAYELIENGF